MALQSLPTIPKTTPATDPAPVALTTPGSGTPGKWRHPRLDEIIKRQNAATFGERNINRVIWNGAALFMSLVFGNTLRSLFNSLRPQSLGEIPQYPDLFLLVLQLFFVLNILVALYPLARPKDDLSDIPLTPTQRKLLGLDPMSTTPLTPGTKYTTPPRYPLSSSRATSTTSRGGSPLSRGASISGYRVQETASYSPPISPLTQKPFAQGSRESGRPSVGTLSPLGLRSSSFGDSGPWPATPTPATGKRTSLGLSNKWLYERSRRLSTGNGAL